MESQNETNSSKTQNAGSFQETHKKSNETGSDRESSIESFHTNTSELSTAAETELIDVDEIELSDEESWLYKSPKKVSSKEKALSTCEWLSKNVEDLDNLELQKTKDALVKKLEELQLRGRKNSLEQSCSLLIYNTSLVKPASTEVADKIISPAAQSCTSTPTVEKISENICPKAVLDATDVHKIAQMQEERLRQTSSRILYQSGRKNSLEQFGLQLYNSRLTKPASVEALNICNGRCDDIISSHPVKNHVQFGSTSTLNVKQDVHRGSLPNIHRGYNSLRSKKSNRSVDKSCPLPVYPSHSKVPMNESRTEGFGYDSQYKFNQSCDFQDSWTLPSSYRVRSKSNYRSPHLSPSSQRESIPFSPTLKRRESAPSSPQKSPAQFLSSCMYQRNGISSSVILQSPTRGSSRQMSPPNSEGNSYSLKRFPLSTMLNRSPKRGNSPALPRKGLKSPPSKASNAVSRSGIPLPASSSKRNVDDSWSNDCF